MGCVGLGRGPREGVEFAVGGLVDVKTADMSSDLVLLALVGGDN